MSRQGLRFDSGSVEEDTLRFVGNSSTYVVKILDDTDGRLELISAALQSAFWAAKGEKPYILVPKNMSSMDEFMVIRLHGIGLLLYGPHGIEELPPIVKNIKHDEMGNEGSVPIKYEEVLQVLERIERLERVVYKVNEIDALVARLERLEVAYNELSNKLLSFEGMRPLHVKPTVQYVPDKIANLNSEIELPSFVKDNPWLDILAGKG